VTAVEDVEGRSDVLPEDGDGALDVSGIDGRVEDPRDHSVHPSLVALIRSRPPG
jgi:hypothetical protein